ncbi:MAG: hypothetical protein E7192_04965 [Erysipelotrichaceae bacterium]|nr:hypothetical protein [Erysipelotrichaceae bacterium]
MKNKYSDLIFLPHPDSKIHRRMSITNRAAQFSPFAALTGYEESVKEVSRWTDSQIFLGEDQIADINNQLKILKQNMDHIVEIIYFEHDSRKKGGHYLKKTSQVKKIDELYRRLILIDETHILMQNIISLQIL